MGSIDRIVRIVIAIAAVLAYYAGIVEGTLGLVLIAVAVIFLLTSLLNFCPLYTIFGVSTCKVKPKD